MGIEMSKYAKGTSVSEGRSREEIHRMLDRWGADEFGYSETRETAYIHFKYKGIRIAMSVPLPSKVDFKNTPTGKARSESVMLKEWEQEKRRRWRSLCLVIKALLTGVGDGVLKFEQAFMPYMVIGDMTLSDRLLPRIKAAIESGDSGQLLLENLTQTASNQ